MVYDPATDFLALWRNVAGAVSKVEMPTLDLTLAALARAGLFTLSVSATAPVANQNTTAWLQTAVPSNSAEGTLHLWDPDAAAYAPATAALFLQLLEASAGQTGVSWFPTTGGPPINTVGNDGDFAIRTDEPGGIYGPKAAGAWPADPIPGTTDIIGSEQLDLTFGDTPGALIIRGPAVWQALEVGAANDVMTAGAIPTWETLSALMDAVFGAVQGDILYRDVATWATLAPSATAGFILQNNGLASNPSWASRTTEFPSGTVMLFQQSAAPPGWTKQTAINDYGLRVTSGSVGSVSGSAFSTVFAQTAVGNTTITTTTMPSHTHTSPAPGATITVVAAAGAAVSQPGANTTGATGGGGSHNHSVNLTLSYVDVIIATKN
jgi:hypothetical protein